MISCGTDGSVRLWDVSSPESDRGGIADEDYLEIQIVDRRAKSIEPNSVDKT